MKSFERVQPKRWDDAVAALAAAKKAGVSAEAKGAGTEHPRSAQGAQPRARISLVDLRRLTGHDSIRRISFRSIAIGALVT